MPDPVVFISSTSEDLKEHREQAARAAEEAGFALRRMESWLPRGDETSLPVCLEKVSHADVVIAIVAHRYGWVPADPGNPDGKSITWLECDHAWNVTGKEVLAFLVDPEYAWPDRGCENYRLVTERKKPGIQEEVERNEQKLIEFKQELSRFVRGTFTDPASLHKLVYKTLLQWRTRNHAGAVSVERQDADTYLKFLQEDTRRIRITGLTTKRAEPYFFDIDQIYTPLTTVVSAETRERDVEPKRVGLEQVLSHRKLVIVGDPGSGKSTFLRRVAFELSRNPGGTFLAPEDRRFPILIRCADLAAFLTADVRDSIPRFLAAQSERYAWGVSEAFFRTRLKTGNCLVLLDGLDEAPERRMRERIARLAERATTAFPKSDFLVSTRPQTNVGDSMLAGFHTVKIGDLELEEMRIFFDHFAAALKLTEIEAKKFKDGLELALNSNAEIRLMAGNPVMLTALAVLQHNEQRLPEYRVELYHSILRWLALAREHKEGRPLAEKCLEQMRKLALYMQDSPRGRLVQINKRYAAEFLTREFGGTGENNELLLEGEALDSGIVASLGTDLKFSHLSFQEYLAAREIASFSDAQQFERVVESGKLYHAEWRETTRLLGGVLRQQGEPRIEGLFQAILSRVGPEASLHDKVRCAALLGAMMRDLSGMGYKPKTPDFERVVKGVAGIFETGEAEQIELGLRVEAADLLGQVGDPRLAENNWITIPAGTFYMGAQTAEKKGRNYDSEAYDESPVHAVTLRPFRIGRFPVTVQEFGAFIADGGYQTPERWVNGGFGQFDEPEDWEQQRKYPSRPVVGVSWFEAAAYCAWAGGRLPTEAEWERAARGPEGGKYPWGNEPKIDPSFANYSETKVGRPTPVGLFPKGNTSEGLCDMLGNVYEWCADWYDKYDSQKCADPRGPAAGTTKVVRGGSWYDFFSWFVRASFRVRFGPTLRFVNIGFRWVGELR